MTQIVPVTKKEMLRRTGVDAFGYTFPAKDTILIRKTLSGEDKRIVLKHEIDHLEKGEEGPFLQFLVPLLGTIIGAVGAKSAADAQTGAQREALGFEKKKYADLAPFREAAAGAIGDIADIESGDFDVQAALERDPGFKFRTSEGQKGFDRLLQARGGRLGGRAIKESIRFNQGQGSQEFQNFLNRKFRLAGFAGKGNNQNISNLITQGGDIQANYASNLSRVAQGGLANYQTYRSSLPPPSSTGYTGPGYTPGSTVRPGTGPLLNF